MRKTRVNFEIKMRAIVSTNKSVEMIAINAVDDIAFAHKFHRLRQGYG